MLFLWLSGKESSYNAGHTGDVGSILRLGRFTGGWNGNPLQCSCLEKSHGEGSPVGFSPWGHKESHMTENAHVHAHTHTLIFNFIFCVSGLRQFPSFSGWE